MRRADYFTLADIIRQKRATWHDCTQDETSEAALAVLEETAREFARRAHLGGMSTTDFLIASGL